MHTAKEQIKNFLLVDQSISTQKKENSQMKLFLTIEPKDLKKNLKKVYLGAKPITEEFFKSQKNKKFKRMSKHKLDIQQNLVYIAATEFIANLSKVHHSLTYLVYLYVNDIKLINTDNSIFERMDHLSTLLKENKIKDLLDTDEINTLHTFNSLRNSVVHSANYESFYTVDKPYMDAINDLLDQVQDLYIYFGRKVVEVPVMNPVKLRFVS